MIRLGAIQEEDELLLEAVIKMTKPLKLVEFGYLQGHSAQIILDAMDSDATLVSYDNNPIAPAINDPRFTLKKHSQTDYNEESADFVFFDASHDFNLNIDTFARVFPTLTEGAIVAVHDTGMWNEEVMNTGGYWLTDGNGTTGYLHRPGERQFVNWVKENYPMDMIHFHTLRITRHGMTLLQVSKQLYL